MKKMIFFVVLLALLPDFIIWQRYIAGIHPVLSLLWWMPTLGLLASWICLKVNYHHNLSIRLLNGFLLCFVFPKLLFAIIQYLHPLPALIVSLALLSVFIYGLTLGWRRLKVRQVSFASPDLPEAFEGYRILHFSDFHLGTFGPRSSFIRQVVRAANRQHVNLMAFTGDLINNKADELLPYMQTLSSLRATDGVFSILGNHDYSEYGNDRSQAYRERNMRLLVERQKIMGWHLLRDEHHAIWRDDDHIQLLGVENISRPPFQMKGNLRRAMQGTTGREFRILLSHDPNHWEMEVQGKTSIQLMLAGHTHGAQIRLGRLTPARLAFRYWGGQALRDGQMLYVSLGLGGAFPFRLGAWPELSVITLRRAPSAESGDALAKTENRGASR